MIVFGQRSAEGRQAPGDDLEDIRGIGARELLIEGGDAHAR